MFYADNKGKYHKGTKPKRKSQEPLGLPAIGKGLSNAIKLGGGLRNRPIGKIKKVVKIGL